MKSKKLAAAMIAAAAAITPLSISAPILAPATVFAEATNENTELPDWVPTDFGSALEFRNTYGTTHIQDGLVCLVFNEERECERKGGTKDEPHYRISTADGVMEQLKDDIYGTENSSSDYEVVVFKPLEAGDFEISLIDNWVKSSSLESEFGYVHYLTYHTFSVDENKTITETDRFSWMPDCITEYQDYVQKNGEVSVKDDLIVFCLDSAAGTPYTWQQMYTGFGNHAELYEYYDCSRETEIPLDGGTIHLLKVFQATNDGYVTIGLEYRDDLIGESNSPAEKSLIADCVVLDDAKTVLLSGDAKVTLIDYDTGEPIAYQHTSGSEFGCLLFRECALGSGYVENPAIVDLETNPCVVNFKDLSKDRDYSFHLEIVNKALGNYTLLPDETSVDRYDNNSYEIVFKLKKSVSCDVNGDGEFSIADVVAVQGFLLGRNSISEWKSADFNGDNKLDVFDLILMKRELIRKTVTTYVKPDREILYGADMYTIAEVPMYLGPDTSYSIVTTIPNNTVLSELGVQNNNDNWAFVAYDGQYGWIQLVTNDGNKQVIVDYPMADKPVIYLYPEQETDVHVELELTEADLSTTYPKYNNGWDVTAYPDGSLLNKADGTHHKYLFWDAVNCRTRFDFSKGFCVAGSDTEAFLREKLTYMGLTEQEMNEFIVYWLPRMEHNTYNLISFQSDAYTDSAKLNISPEPDSLLRIFMAYVPLEDAVEIEPQELDTFERNGFTVVEWGGSEI